MKLSQSQQTAVNAVVEAVARPGSVSTLVGPAGSGKTTVMREVIAQVGGNRDVVLAAPTGKAALRLGESVGSSASTMHSLLYKEVSEDDDGEVTFRQPRPPCMPGDVLIVDEASMIGETLYRDFHSKMPKTASVLYVGDKEQLSPVKDLLGPDLERPTAELTEVHRQALDSPILQYATAIRQGQGPQWAHEYASGQRERDERLTLGKGCLAAVDWLVGHREAGDDATLLAYTNKVRRWLNKQVRSRLALDSDFVVPGDLLIVKANNRDNLLRNGEVVTVKAVRRSRVPKLLELDIEERKHPVYVWADLVESSDSSEFYRRFKQSISAAKRGMAKSGILAAEALRMAANQLHVHYGQCITVHASQGSEWEHVGFASGPAVERMAFGDPEEHRRLTYTAVTRARASLSVFGQ